MAEVQQILLLLDKADVALQEKRLTTPAHNNANDYFRQVLAISPENQVAHEGLNKIVQSYLNWGRGALSAGQLDRAKIYVSRAAKVDAKNPGVLKLSQQIKAAEASKLQRALAQGEQSTSGHMDSEADAVESASESVGDNFVSIDVNELKERSLDVRVRLFKLADDVRKKNARVLILAPSDKDGRWMYQQLNNRHADYRVRASLRIDDQAGVRILE